MEAFVSVVTGISWARSTFNPWWGCTRWSAGCNACYAETLDHRWGGDHWGKGATRRVASDAYWRGPIRWNAAAAKEQDAALRAGKAPSPWRVFCASMCDVFDAEVPQEWRDRLWALIAATPHLTWMLLTKRPENVRAMLPAGWLQTPRDNVWIGCTVEDQAAADKRLASFREIPAVVRFVSYEPALGPVGWTPWLGFASWLIVGGESGPKARPFQIQWARDTVRTCRDAGIAPFVKQMGSRPMIGGEARVYFTGKGDDPTEWPAYIRVQEFPDTPRASPLPAIDPDEIPF